MSEELRRIEQDELKKIQIEILKTIHAFCVEHGIKYFLCGGTLLGAVRHKGFIPWDDDIDICMPREDYEKFANSFTATYYKVLDANHTKKYFLPFAKVIDTRTITKELIAKDIPDCGVYVDVFPLDGLSNNKSIAKKLLRKNGRLMKINSALLAPPKKLCNFKDLVKKAMGVVYSPDKILKKILKNSKQYTYGNSLYVGVAFGYYGEREIFRADIFEKRVELLFEKDCFFAPKQYDQYLQGLYGDYMKLPPVEKQKTHHSFEAYWRSEY